MNDDFFIKLKPRINQKTNKEKDKRRNFHNTKPNYFF